MKKAKKIGLSLNRKVISNLQKVGIIGGTGGTSHCDSGLVITCTPTCSPTDSRQNCTIGCAD